MVYNLNTYFFLILVCASYEKFNWRQGICQYIRGVNTFLWIVNWPILSCEFVNLAKLCCEFVNWNVCVKCEFGLFRLWICEFVCFKLWICEFVCLCEVWILLFWLVNLRIWVSVWIGNFAILSCINPFSEIQVFAVSSFFSIFRDNFQ